MSPNKLKFGGALGVAATVFIAMMARHGHSAQRESTEGNAVRDLLVQRHAVLEQIVQLSIDAYRTGETEFPSVARAQRTLLESQLDLAETAEDRVAAVQDMLKLVTQSEKIAQQRFQTGNATQLDVLESQAIRLKTEAQLLVESRQQQRAN